MGSAPRIGSNENFTTTTAVYSHSSLVGSCLARHIENSEQTSTVEANKMRRSTRLAQKQDANLENEDQKEPKAKKGRSDNRISDIATLDNGTMVESFKFFNYCQLAKKSLVSKRFRDLIQTHRHKLALLFVDKKTLEFGSWSYQIFNNELSSEAYNDWIVRNGYSEQVPLKAVRGRPQYQLYAYGNYKNPNRERITVFYALIKELNHETRPLFQHFVRLLTDPFIYIRNMELVPQESVFNLLVEVIDRSNRGRIQCEELEFDLKGNSTKFFNWITEHMCCANFQIAVRDDKVNFNEQLLDFFATGSDCASEIHVRYFRFSKAVIIELVKKFMGFKDCDEIHIVHSISGFVSEPIAGALKSNYEKFFIKEESSENRYSSSTAHIFEFVNVDIGKKLRLTITQYTAYKKERQVTLKIIDL
ncbi:hypothetical protein Ddc_24344 [Ditylenchus destructor]|nr:hypothetical protein Ddc_24344 [Ditylenchus destructor]